MATPEQAKKPTTLQMAEFLNTLDKAAQQLESWVDGQDAVGCGLALELRDIRYRVSAVVETQK